MAAGYIPIMDQLGEDLGRIEYAGTMEKGVWSFEPSKRYGKERRAELSRLFDEAVRRGEELKQINFMQPDFTRTPGWTGFWGVANAARHALGVVRMFVDWNGIKPPHKPFLGEYDVKL